MCLAVPMRVESIDGEMGTVRSAGLTLRISLALVEDVAPGDYVIVHAGYAIQQLTATEARETLDILERLEEFHAGESDG